MSGSTLGDVARFFLTQPDAFRSTWQHPVLVWEAPPDSADDDEMILTTDFGSRKVPQRGSPIIFPVKKLNHAGNVFAMGVTMGRAPHNDIAVHDSSVSAFHAFFQQDPKLGWVITDAESKNGSWVNALKLAPNVRTPVPENSRVRIGFVELTFRSAESFTAWLKAQ